MEVAYVLVQCDLGHEIDIIKQLEKVPEIKEVRGTYGVFDIFVRIQADSKDQIDDMITKIRKTTHIRGTNTLIAILTQGGR